MRKTTKQIFLDRFEVQDSKAGDFFIIFTAIAGTIAIVGLIHACLHTPTDAEMMRSAATKLKKPDLWAHYYLNPLPRVPRDDLVNFFSIWGTTHPVDLWKFLKLYERHGNNVLSQYPTDYAQLTLVKIGLELLKHGDYVYQTSKFTQTLVADASDLTLNIQNVPRQIMLLSYELKKAGVVNAGDHSLRSHIIDITQLKSFVPQRSSNNEYPDFFYTSELALPKVRFTDPDYIR